MPALFTLPKQIPLSSAGELLPGARLYFYQTGTSTPQNTYQDILLATPHANPVEADAAGIFAPIYLDASLPHYRVRLTTDADVLIYQVDNVPSNQNAAQTFRLVSAAPNLVFEETDAAANNKKWAIKVNGQTFRISILNDAESVETDLLNASRSGTASGALSLLPSTSGTIDFLPSASGNLNVLTGGVGQFFYKNREVATISAGSFTATVTGFSNVSQLDCQYNRIGSPGATSTVILTIPGFSGTSNATTFTLTHSVTSIAASPTMLQPVFVTNNGSDVAGNVRILTASSTTIRFGVSAAEGGFTGSGSKGIPGEYINLVYKCAAA